MIRETARSHAWTQIYCRKIKKGREELSRECSRLGAQRLQI